MAQNKARGTINIREELQTILEWIATPDARLSDALPQSLRDWSEMARDDESTFELQQTIVSVAESRVYGAIRDAILDHRLAPGTKLKEIPLAEIFGVSRATIRNVLALLAHERLAELRLNRGAAVANPSLEESHEIFEARRAVECAIVARAARAARPQDIDALREQVSAEQVAHTSGDERAAIRCAVDFHRKLGVAARNGVLAGFLESLLLRTPLVALAHRGHASATCSWNEHAALVDALAARDEARAVALIQEHLGRIEGELVRSRPAPPQALADIFRDASPPADDAS
jgi:DNA-binding GntR family transcriptional regulator